MKRILQLLLAAGSLGVQADVASVLDELGDLQWQYRIILVDATGDAAAAKALLESERAAIIDRDIAWFVFDGDDVSTNYPGKMAGDFVEETRDRYLAEDDKVILIGKDGGVKSRSGSIDLEAMFSRIDAMPMRRLEMGE